MSKWSSNSWRSRGPRKSTQWWKLKEIVLLSPAVIEFNRGLSLRSWIANQLRSLKAHVGWLVGVLFPSSCLRRGTHPIAIKLIQLERLGLPVYSFQRWYFQFWSTIKYFPPWERFFTSTCSPKVTGRSFDWAQYVRESFGCFVFLYFAIWYGAFAICHLAAVQRWQFFVCSFVFLLLYVFIVLYFVIYCGAFAFCILHFAFVQWWQWLSFSHMFLFLFCVFVCLYFCILPSIVMHLGAVQRWQWLKCIFSFCHLFLRLFFCILFLFCIFHLVACKSWKWSTLTNCFSTDQFCCCHMCIALFLSFVLLSCCCFAFFNFAFGIWQLSSGDND